MERNLMYLRSLKEALKKISLLLALNKHQIDVCNKKVRNLKELKLSKISQRDSLVIERTNNLNNYSSTNDAQFEAVNIIGLVKDSFYIMTLIIVLILVISSNNFGLTQLLSCSLLVPANLLAGYLSSIALSNAVVKKMTKYKDDKIVTKNGKPKKLYKYNTYEELKNERFKLNNTIVDLDSEIRTLNFDIKNIDSEIDILNACIEVYKDENNKLKDYLMCCNNVSNDLSHLSCDKQYSKQYFRNGGKNNAEAQRHL